ncbi:acetate uptake transporter [Calidifontibacillus erzurumensis]|uniref:Acetate uptake transporter n=1 Tax=Calidifontibacillus erzurumensis TaxID=2741433 RepID=A0A8J8K7B9_9BACI|nr:acetate uptake transporter [Calidifontibacillus erzurumensis]NSL50586.1 acetate uptake transporter [Calidifontibacillus erzurumensis]
MENMGTITEVKVKMSDPTALGVFGLAIVTLVAASQKMGWTTGVEYVLPWAIFLGSLAQIWASIIDFKNNNYFGAIALGIYGLFWMGVAAHWAISLGWIGELSPAADPRQLAVAFFGYMIFSLFIMVAAFEIHTVMAAILVLINILFFSLGMATLGINHELFATIAAYTEFLISLLGFYLCGATFLNNFFGRTVLSLGKPLGLIAKGPIEVKNKKAIKVAENM